jgi:hypothetical protein
MISKPAETPIDVDTDEPLNTKRCQRVYSQTKVPLPVTRSTQKPNDQWWLKLIDLDYCRPLDQISQSHMVLLMLPRRGFGEFTFRIASHKQGFFLSSDMAICKTLQKTYYGVYPTCSVDSMLHDAYMPLGKSIAALQQLTILIAGCCLKSMFATADWLFAEDQFDKCFGSLDGSIPTVRGTSTAIKSCVNGVAASCGTITTAKNSTTIGCAAQTPLVLLLVVRVLWNSDSPVISFRLVRKSPCTTGSCCRSSSLWDS